MSRGPWLKKAKAQVMPNMRNRPRMEKEFVLMELWSRVFLAVELRRTIWRTVMMNMLKVKMNTIA